MIDDVWGVVEDWDDEDDRCPKCDHKAELYRVEGYNGREMILCDDCIKRYPDELMEHLLEGLENDTEDCTCAYCGTTDKEAICKLTGYDGRYKIICEDCYENIYNNCFVGSAPGEEASRLVDELCAFFYW